MSSNEPRFSRIAALIADPTRARMLAVLLGGEYRSAGELASAAGITRQANAGPSPPTSRSNAPAVAMGTWQAS